MAKDPARVAAGKKAWREMSPAKKAAVIRRLRPFRKGGGGKMARRGGGGSPARSNPGRSGSSTPKLGASYQAFVRGAVVVSPLTDLALAKELTQTGLRSRSDALRNDPWPYVQNVGIVAADVAIDKATGQTGALSRGSITAWAPEIYLGWSAMQDSKAGLSLRDVQRRALVRRQGYDPALNSTHYDAPGFHTYRTLRHGGQAIRYVANRTAIGQRVKRAIITPLTRILGVTT